MKDTHTHQIKLFQKSLFNQSLFPGIQVFSRFFTITDSTVIIPENMYWPLLRCFLGHSLARGLMEVEYTWLQFYMWHDNPEELVDYHPVHS